MEKSEEVGSKRLCFRCVEEEFLQNWIKTEGEVTICSYCRKRRRSVSIEEIADRVETMIEEHFQWTPDSPSSMEYSAIKEGILDWDRRGEPIADVIAWAAEVDEAIAEDIREVLDDRTSDVESSRMGEENPFESDAHYEDKDAEDHEYRTEWAEFEASLKTEARYFGKRGESVLDSVFQGLHQHTTNDGKPVISDAGPGTKLDAFYRARVFQSGANLEAALKRPDLGIGPPPFSSALAGRMNARGIAVFYGATDPATALAEVRPPIGSRVVVAKFTVIRPLRILEIEALRSLYVRGSLFDPSFLRQLKRAKFLERLSNRIAMPVMPDDEPFDYLATQAIAEYLASRQEPAIDGMIYPSVQQGQQQSNVVLFHKAARVAALELPKGTEISAHLTSTDDEGEHPDYWVWEETPEVEEPPEEKGSEKSGWPLLALDDFDDSLPGNFDFREATLRIELDSIKVHHVQAVSFSTESHDVRRHRTKKTDPEF